MLPAPRRVAFAVLLPSLLVVACVGRAAAVESCGTRFTPDEARAQRERWIDSGLIGRAMPTHKLGCSIGIAAHFVRDGQGQGGLPPSQYDQAIADVNAAYAAAGIGFVTVSTDTIDDDAFFSGPFDVDDLRAVNVVPNAINVWFTPNVELNACGISSYTTSAVQGIVVLNSCVGVSTNTSTLAHEIGHYFDLYHTHETVFGDELVNGSNCDVAGDLLCDTPADPGLDSSNMNAICAYTGTATDANGDPYAPDTSLIMSYATPKVCRDTFSPQSLQRVWTTLLSFRPELNAGCAIPTLSVTDVSPATADPVSTLDVTLDGQNLDLAQSIAFGADVVVHSLTYQPPSSLVVRISVLPAATAGARDVVVAAAVDTLTLPGAFMVGATPASTPYHYVSPAGADVFPYWSAEMAAASLTAAVAAADSGDVVRLDDTPRAGVSLLLQQAVTLEGGWNSGFTSRDPVGTRSSLALAPNVEVLNAAGTVVLDGLALSGGSGSLQLGPVFGDAGGALRIVGSNVMVSECRLHDNNAPYGGAVFVHAGTVSLIDVTLDLNGIATAGGAMYASQSTLDLQRVTVVDNATSNDGAGLYLTGCTTIVDDVLLRGNQSVIASRGGGLYAQGGQLSLLHGSVVDNTAAQGGGLYLDGVSSGQVAACTFDANESGAVFENSPVDVFDIIVSNSVEDGIVCIGTLPLLTYDLVWGSGGSDTVGCTLGVGSLSADPLYVDPASGDYHLGMHSPGIDAGDPDAQDADPDGSRADLGRYGTGTFEFLQPSVPQGVRGTLQGGAVVLDWVDNPEPDIDVYAVYAAPASGFVPSASNLVTITTAPPVDLGPFVQTTYCRVSAVDQDGYAGGYSAEVEVSPTARPGLRTPFYVRGAYPNPFNPATTIEFGLPTTALVRVTIYDVRGREVETLLSRPLDAGVHRVRWDARDLASGTYFARVVAGDHDERVKLVLVK